MQIYKYLAFELLVTLDLEVYKAVRRIIVPADLKFGGLHKFPCNYTYDGISTPKTL